MLAPTRVVLDQPEGRALTHQPEAAIARRTRVVWRVSLCLLGLQLIGMLVFTTVQYERFNLTTDFAAYSQAWTAIVPPSGCSIET